jgi:hypothetical protein
MSDIGLNSGLYGQMREYAELLDDVLIGLKTNVALPSDSRQRLADFLTALEADNWQDVPTRVIAILLRDKAYVEKNDWPALASALLSDEIDETVINKLERLAWSLEQEQSIAMARIRGPAQ